MAESERTTDLGAEPGHARLMRLALEKTADVLEDRLLEFGQMARIGSLFASSARLDEVAARGLEVLLDSTPAENGSIMLYSREDDGLSMLAAGARNGRMSFYGLDGNPLVLFKPGEGLAGRALKLGKPVVAPDATADPHFMRGKGKIKIGSMASLPMVVDGKPLGVVNLSHPEPDAILPGNMAHWSLLAGYLAVALSNSILLMRLRTANDRLTAEVESRTKSLTEANASLKAAQDKIARNNEELKLKVEERSSELKSALNVLRERTESLERANRIKDEFLNNINHELKTPLNAIIGYAGLLLKEGEGMRPEAYADLEVIESNGRHLQQIIDNILALKEIEGGNVEPEYLRSSLGELLKMAVTSVQPRARAKGLTVNLDEAEQFPSFLFDPTLIRRVVYNLLDNAIKFSAKGAISVTVIRREQAAGAPPLVVVEVEDEGRGVKPDDVERIFLKFQQGEPSMRKQEGGSGVGLTIARTLVELHGGTFGYAPSASGGSVFSFSLPMRT